MEPAAQRPDRSTRPAIGHLPGLDGVRALAVLAVVVYHADSRWLPGGFLGVEAFFVLSGFLITRLLVAEHAGVGRIDLRDFWRRRARRLMPAVLAVLSGVVVLTAATRPEAAGQVRGDVVAALGYASNWYQIAVGSGYTASGDFAPLRHLWSLAIEEQFYVVWPFVLALLLRGGASRGAIAVILGTAAASVGVVVAVLVDSGVGVDPLYLSTPSRSSGLLIGAALGLVRRRSSRGWSDPLAPGGIGPDLAAIAAAILLAVMARGMWLTGDDAHPLLFRGGFVLVDVATAVLIVAAGGAGPWVTRICSIAVLRWVGTRSYGLYLFHWPVFQSIRGVAGVPLTLVEFVGAMVVSAVLAELSYRAVEMPVRALGWRQSASAAVRTVRTGGLAGRAWAAGVLVAMVVFGASVVRVGTADVEVNELEAGLAEAAASVVELDVMLAGVSPLSNPPEPVSLVQAASRPAATVPETAAPPSSGLATAAPPSSVPVPSVPEAVAPSDQRIQLLAIGDSVMLGAAAELSDRGWVVNAQRSRQVWDVTEMFALLRVGGFLGDAVVVHLGTNGPFTDEALDEVLDALSDVPVVVLVTIRAQRSWSAGNSERIRQRAGGNVVVVDWAIESGRCPGNCFMDDGIHLRPDGRRFYADLVSRAAATATLAANW